MGLYMIVANLAVLIIQQAIGMIITSTDPIRRINYVLTIFASGQLIAQAFCYYMSGFDYAERMTGVQDEKIENVQQVIQLVPHFGGLLAQNENRARMNSKFFDVQLVRSKSTIIKPKPSIEESDQNLFKQKKYRQTTNIGGTITSLDSHGSLGIE